MQIFRRPYFNSLTAANSGGSKNLITNYILTRANFSFGKEICNFQSSIFQAVGTMHGIFPNRLGKISADSSGSGLFRISRPHQFAIFCYCVLTFKYLNHHRTANHKINQILKKRTLFMNGVESLSLLPAEMLHFCRHNL